MENELIYRFICRPDFQKVFPQSISQSTAKRSAKWPAHQHHNFCNFCNLCRGSQSQFGVSPASLCHFKFCIENNVTIPSLLTSNGSNRQIRMLGKDLHVQLLHSALENADKTLLLKRQTTSSIFCNTFERTCMMKFYTTKARQSKQYQKIIQTTPSMAGLKGYFVFN